MGFRLCQRLVDVRRRAGAAARSWSSARSRARPTTASGSPSSSPAGAEEDLRLAPRGWYRDARHRPPPRRSGGARGPRRVRRCEAASGATVPFDRLVLATGSRPFVPPIPGAELPGVFVYRTVDDLRAIREPGAPGGARRGHRRRACSAWRRRGRSQELGLEVHVIEASPGSFPRQLDETGARPPAASRSRRSACASTPGARTARIEGAGRRARASRSTGGERIAVDLVVLAAGIRPRGELARAGGLDAGGTAGASSSTITCRAPIRASSRSASAPRTAASPTAWRRPATG